MKVVSTESGMQAADRVQIDRLTGKPEVAPARGAAQAAPPDSQALSIGQVSAAAGLPIKTVRYYSDIGLVRPRGRSDAGYRQYGQPELKRLRFVRRARSFGFSVEACRELLGLYQDDGRSSREVKDIALRRLQEIETKMQELQRLHEDLSRVAKSCRGDDAPNCPILENLAEAVAE